MRRSQFSGELVARPSLQATVPSLWSVKTVSLLVCSRAASKSLSSWQERKAMRLGSPRTKGILTRFSMKKRSCWRRPTMNLLKGVGKTRRRRYKKPWDHHAQGDQREQGDLLGSTSDDPL